MNNKIINDSSIDGIAEKNIDCFPSCIIIIIYILIHINRKYTEKILQKYFLQKYFLKIPKPNVSKQNNIKAVIVYSR